MVVAVVVVGGGGGGGWLINVPETCWCGPHDCYFGGGGGGGGGVGWLVD